MKSAVVELREMAKKYRIRAAAARDPEEKIRLLKREKAVSCFADYIGKRGKVERAVMGEMR